MLELLDIHFNYLCRTTFQNESGQCPIILRIVFRGERRGIFSGLYCFKDNWVKKGRKILKAENGLVNNGFYRGRRKYIVCRPLTKKMRQRGTSGC